MDLEISGQEWSLKSWELVLSRKGQEGSIHKVRYVQIYIYGKIVVIRLDGVPVSLSQALAARTLHRLPSAKIHRLSENSWCSQVLYHPQLPSAQYADAPGSKPSEQCESH